MDKLYNASYEIYELDNTDFYIEIIRDEIDAEYYDVWLCRRGYGIKTLMFGIQRDDTFFDIIESNVDAYIEQYIKDYE